MNPTPPLGPPPSSTSSRRAFLEGATTSAGLGLLAQVEASGASAATGAGEAGTDADLLRGPTPPDYRVRHGRIRQSIMGWTYSPMPVPELAKLCKEIGLVAMEGVDAKFYPRIKELGLEISITGSHGFAQGPFNPANHDMVEAKLREGIDLAVQVGCKNVITFTGMRQAGITEEAGAKNCVECWKRVAPYAEQKQVRLCLEHLNSRDASHPMKGHPGYFGDDVDLCVDLIRRVDSPAMKLLFDIYHVQIMNGDVIRRLQKYREVIAHVHTAGVPGRGELDHHQEVNYPAVMRALLDLGYTGFVAQEFLPTWPDRAQALRHAARVCDV